MSDARQFTFNAALMTVGRIGFVALWFVAAVLVYRGLGSDTGGVAQAGLFAMSIAVVKVVAGCISDPIDLALMRRVPTLLTQAPDEAFRLLRAAFGLRLLGASLIAAALFGFGPDLATLLFHPAEAVPPLGIVAVAILGDTVLRAILITLQAGERFVAFVALEGALQLMRFGGVLALWAAGVMSVELAIGIYAAASVIAALGGVFLLPSGLLPSGLVPSGLVTGVGTGWREMAELLGYLKWMTPGMVLAALNERLDVFLVNSFTGAEAAGLYGAMLTFALVPDLVAGCLSSVLQPRIAQLHQSGQFQSVLRKTLLVAIPVCGLGLLVAIPLAAPLITLLLGPAYLPGLPAFLWVLAGTVFWLAVTPLPLTLMAVMVPSRLVLMTLAQSAILLLFGLLLLPTFGMVGMAQTVCAVRVCVGLMVLVAGYRLAPPRTDEASARLQARPAA